MHSWDECGIMLNVFNEKRKVKCTVKKTRGKNSNTFYNGDTAAEKNIENGAK